MRPATHTRFLVCHLCGREFGTASLPIHLKQCQSKNGSIKGTQMVITSGRPAAPGKPRPGTAAAAVVVDKSSGDESEKILEALSAVKAGDMSIAQFNAMATADYDEHAVDRGVKIPCESCGRTFARLEGLEKHKSVCQQNIKAFQPLKAHSGRNSQQYPSASKPSARPTTAASVKSTVSLRPTTAATATSSNNNNNRSSTTSINPKTTSNQESSNEFTMKGTKVCVSRPITSSPSKQSISNSNRPKTAAAPVKTYAQFCAQCGQNFLKADQDNLKWKFCPICGTCRS